MEKIVIFGASGDLAKRKLIPAISKLKNKDVKIYGYARSQLAGKYATELRKHGNYRDDFPERIVYISGEYTDLTPLRGIIDAKTIVYLALPPQVYDTVLSALQSFEYGIIGIEKPYGESREACMSLMKFDSPKIRLIDHYLLKPMMAAMPTIKQKHPQVFEKLSKENVSSVYCYFLEDELVGGRPYFDSAGIVQDVMQNHLVEVIATIISKPGKKGRSEERRSILENMTISIDRTYFGQYESYRREFGRLSNTETFAAFICNVNTPEWRGVPFFMAAGKGMNRKITEVRFQIRYDRNSQFPGFNGCSSILFNIAPFNEFSTHTGWLGQREKGLICSSEEMGEMAGTGDMGDYEALFDAMIKGRDFPSVSFDEAAEMWRLFSRVTTIKKNLVHYRDGIGLPIEVRKLFSEGVSKK